MLSLTSSLNGCPFSSCHDSYAQFSAQVKKDGITEDLHESAGKDGRIGGIGGEAGG